MNRKRAVALALSVLVGFVLLPVLIEKFRSPPTRTLDGVRLADTPYREIKFRNERQNVDLAGMILVPKGPGPFPAAVVIHGSGTSRRDNKWYLTMVDYLNRHGIAVLLPDKRGSEKSGGDWRSTSFGDLATDTVAAVSHMRQQKDIPISKIGIIGLSQGGQIAPVVATKSSDVAFLISVVGGVGPIHDQLQFEENQNLRQMGFLPGVSNVVAYLSTVYLTRVGQKRFWDAIGDFNNIPFWRQVSVPSLAIFGSDDTNVDSVWTAVTLESLQKPNLTVSVYEGSGHALEDPPEQGDRIFRKDALEQIVRFIRADRGKE